MLRSCKVLFVRKYMFLIFEDCQDAGRDHDAILVLPENNEYS